ncbi:MAG: M48 family metallopeptidase [Mycolicibacterium sp.]|uniref:M48 family metallopeptidase n=1 Tax=Mycolicibacterium sp. TaxID=2320850 RepID=UPI003D0CE5DB
MSATFRAVASLVALAGFLVLAFTLITAVMLCAFVLPMPPVVKGWLVAAALVGAMAIVNGLWKAATTRPELLPGVDLTVADAPELWTQVTELSASAGTRGPDQIRLVGDARAAVSEDARLLGIVGGPRRLYLGVPCLQGLSVTQLRAVLAHEFGHYSRAHTRLGPFAYRAYQAVMDIMQRLRAPDANWLLRIYGNVLWVYAAAYHTVSMAISRSQEHEADRLMVQIAGRKNAQEALREIDLIGACWMVYVEELIGPGWSLDLAPTADEFFGGFQRWLAASVDLDIMRDRPPSAMGSLGTHPPTAERIAAMATLPDCPVSPRDDRRASTLIPTFATAAAATAEESYVFGYRERLDWDDLVGRIATMDDDRTANAVYRAAALLHEQQTPTLGMVVELSEAGRATELVKSVAGSDRPVEEVANEVFSALARAAAVHSGIGHWRMSWAKSGPELVTADGEIIDAESIAALLTDANAAPEAAARLTALGINLTTAGPAPETPTANTSEIVGGIADITADETTYDVLVLDTGLILAEKPHDNRQGGAGRLDTLAKSGSVAAIAARHRFVPYESMASGKVSGRRNMRATITLRDGTTLRLNKHKSSACLTEGSDKVFANYVRHVDQQAG